MDCNIIKNNICLCKTALDSFLEERVDFDIIIPDYCAAAVKILKCDVRPAVNTKSLDGDRLTINGTCTVNVIYIDEETGLIKSISDSVPFIQTQTLKEELSNYRIKLKVRTSNVTCRLQNSRRISVKALIGIAIKVMGNDEREIITGFEDCDIETMFEQSKCCVYINSNEADIRISGEANLSSNANEIIKCDANIFVNDIKLINDKVIIKGEAAVNCIYSIGDSVSDLESLDTVIPFSEIIDVDGATETGICDVECDLTALRCDIGNSTESNIVNFDIEAKAIASVYDNTEINILRDVYSKEHDLEFKTKELTIESLNENLNFTDIIRDTIEVDFENAVLTDITAKSVIKNISSRDNMIIADGDIFVTVYAHNDSEYRVFDKTVPFSVSREMPHFFKQIRCEAKSNIRNVSVSMPDEKNADVKAEINLNLLIFSRDTYDIVDSIEVNYDSTSDRFGSKVVLYYADKGESLWDIAKKYYTSVNILKRDNGIENDKIESDRMILISRN